MNLRNFRTSPLKSLKSISGTEGGKSPARKGRRGSPKANEDEEAWMGVGVREEPGSGRRSRRQNRSSLSPSSPGPTHSPGPRGQRGRHQRIRASRRGRAGPRRVHRHGLWADPGHCNRGNSCSVHVSRVPCVQPELH